MAWGVGSFVFIIDCFFRGETFFLYFSLFEFAFIDVFASMLRRNGKSGR
ncbi:hypothetical protein CCP2SC5_70049 [Azospirillaceae bacterium]